MVAFINYLIFLVLKLLRIYRTQFVVDEVEEIL
jgi:hypothetical protein